MTRWNNNEANKRKESIVSTLTDLIKERPLADITVGDLCAACDIPRQTFYYHFKNMEGVFFWAFTSRFDKSAEKPTFVGGVCGVCEALYSRKELTQAFLSSPYRMKVFYMFKDVFRTSTTEYVEAKLGEDVSEEVRTFVVKIIVNASLGIVMNWVDEGMTMPVSAIREGLTEAIGAHRRIGLR